MIANLIALYKKWRYYILCEYSKFSIANLRYLKSTQVGYCLYVWCKRIARISNIQWAWKILHGVEHASTIFFAVQPFPHVRKRRRRKECVQTFEYSSLAAEWVMANLPISLRPYIEWSVVWVFCSISHNFTFMVKHEKIFKTNLQASHPYVKTDDQKLALWWQWKSWMSIERGKGHIDSCFGISCFLFRSQWNAKCFQFLNSCQRVCDCSCL